MDDFINNYISYNLCSSALKIMVEMKKKCKHEFVHATVTSWYNMHVKVYCKHCGIDADDLSYKRKSIKKKYLVYVK